MPYKHYVDLQEELGNALEKGFKQFKHAQISRQTKEIVVLLPVLLHCVRIGCDPNDTKAFFQQLVIPNNRPNKMKTKSGKVGVTIILQLVINSPFCAT